MSIDPIGFDKMIKYQLENEQIVKALKEYVSIMATEPRGQIVSFDKIYHDLNRMLGNEV